MTPDYIAAAQAALARALAKVDVLPAFVPHELTVIWTHDEAGLPHAAYIERLTERRPLGKKARADVTGVRR